MKEVRPSTRQGMGAILHDDGVTFRIWAPHADAVFVAGAFNDWSKDATPLAREEEGGYWSADVAEAKAGDEYRYVIRAGDRELWRIDPCARAVTNSVGNAIIHNPAFDWGQEPLPTPPWNEMVIYEMHVGTFNPQSRKRSGTFLEAIERLPHLRDLGVNMIHVMPPTEFGGAFSWGYNPACPFAVASDYGGPNAFKQFVQAAHAHGIGVIVCVVYNHFGPNDLALWQFDGWSENGLGGIYFYNDWRSETPWGHTRPDYGRPEVRNYIRDNALMWIEEYHCDGHRWDGTAYMRNVHGHDGDPGSDLPDGWSLIQEINREIHERHPGKITIAEDLRNNAAITQETAEGGAGFGAQWAARFVHPVRAALIAPDDAARDLNAVRDAILHRYATDAFERVIYTESHDEIANGRARVPEEIWPGHADSWFSKKRSTLGAVLVFTAPGIPMIFQGQEFLENEWFHDRDHLDWSRAETFAGIVRLYRDLIRLRRNGDDTTRGLRGQHVEVFHVNNEAKVLAFHRWDQGGPRDSTVVVLNFANREQKDYAIGFPRGGVWKVRFNSDARVYDGEFGNLKCPNPRARNSERDGQPCQGKLSIAPYSSLILSQDG
jgi:1,4-alpha-glucan branching enzyme